MRLNTFFWMMPHSISLALFLLVFWLSFSLYISLSLSCPALVFFCLLLHKQTKTAISLHITLEENYGYFPRVSVFCTHFFFFKCSTKCMSVKGALLLSQVDVCWILFHITLKAQRMNDMNCACWERMHRPECYRQIQTRLFWIDQEWAKSQRGSWTCCRAWQV